MDMDSDKQTGGIPEEGSGRDWTPDPSYAAPDVPSKMDWMDLPFRQVRGQDLHSEETERFYHTLA